MSDIAIRTSGLGKQFSLGNGSPVRAHEAIERIIRGSAWRSARSAEESFWAVRDCSFTLQRGEVAAVLGRNGAGKSVLLKMLSRIVKPTTGSAEIHGRLASLLGIGSGFHPEMTGRENVFLNGAILGVHKEEMERKFEDIVEFSGVRRFLDVPVKRYSSGMYMRLAFSVATYVEADIFLIDEVLAVGDEAFRVKCLERLQSAARNGATILLVSHSMRLVSELCTHAIYLESGRIVYDGEPAEAIRRYQEADLKG